MAYSASVNVEPSRNGNGRLQYLVTITETEAGPATEYSVTDLPPIWTLVRVTTAKTGGTGATVQPIFGAEAGFTTTSAKYHGGEAAAAAYVNDQYAIVGYGSTLYGRSQVNANTSNLVTVLIILEGGQ